MRKKNNSSGGKAPVSLTAIIILLTVFVLASVIFVGNELLQNSRYYLREVQNQEQKNMELMGKSLDRLYSSGSDQQTLIRFLEENAPPSGSSFCYLVFGSEVIFARDGATTESLGEYRDFQLFRESYAEQKVQWTSAEFGDGQYRVGSVRSQMYLLKQGKVIKHTVYIVLPLILCTAVYYILTVAFAAFWLDKDRKCRALREQIRENRRKIDMLSSENDRLTEASRSHSGKTISDRDTVLELLKKSDDPALHPLSVGILKIRNGILFSHSEFYNLVLIVQGHLNPDQLAAVTGPDEITLLLYHTSRADARNICRICEEDLMRESRVHDLQIHSVILSTEDPAAGDMLQYYRKTAEDLKGTVVG